MNKKGISGVVTMLIIISLVLVAIGIVWAVISNLILGSEKQININQKCVTTLLKIDNANCDGTDCTLQVSKKGGYEIDGIKIIVSNDTANSEVFQKAGDIDLLASFEDITGTGVNVANKISLVAYFTDADEEILDCSQVAEFNLS